MLCVFTSVEGNSPKCEGPCIKEGEMCALPCCCKGSRCLRVAPNSPMSFCVKTQGDANVEEESARDENESADMGSFLQSMGEEKW